MARFYREDNMVAPSEDPDVTEGLRVFKLVMYIVIFVISVPANIYMLLAVTRKAYRHWNTAKSYICFIQNLAVADFLLVFFSIPFDLAWHEAKRFTYGEIMCRTLWPLQTWSLQAIVLLYLALMCHRVIGVMGQLYGQLKYKFAVWVSIFIWLLAFCTVIPYIIILKHDYLRQTCDESWLHIEHRQVYTVALFLLQYGTPLIAMVAMYIYVKRKLGNFKVMEPFRAKRRNRHRSVNNMLLAYIIVFAVLLLPHQIMWFLLDFKDGINMPHFQSVLDVLYILTYSITIANPILFYIYNDEFERDFLYFLKFKCVRRTTREEDLSDSFSEDEFDGRSVGTYSVDGGYNEKSSSLSYVNVEKSFHSFDAPSLSRNGYYESQNTLHSQSHSSSTPRGEFKMSKGLFTSTLDRCKAADKRMSDIRTSTSLASRSGQSLAGSEYERRIDTPHEKFLNIGHENYLSDELL